MGLFGDKKKLVTVEQVMAECRKLSRALLQYYQSGGNNYEERDRILKGSGINEYTWGHTYSNCNEIMKSSLKIRIEENFGNIILVMSDKNLPGGTDTVTVRMYEEYDKNASMAFMVSAVVPVKKWEKKYGHLKHGDTFPLDGPAKLFYNYDPSGLDVRFYSTYMHMGEKSLTSFHPKIYL